jgi:NAD+ synthase
VSRADANTVTVAHRDDRRVDATRRECEQFVRSVVEDAGAEGVVVAMSGGVDSTTAATLAVEALGPERVYGLVLPADATGEANRRDAQDTAERLCIDFRTVDVQPVVDVFEHALTREQWLRGNPAVAHQQAEGETHDGDPDGLTEALGNLAARVRMAAAYFEANTTDRLVLGTSNRTELLLGYFTKHGDGGSDLLPLGDLYKTEVRALATALGVPDSIVRKPATADLWRDQTDVDDLGAPYGTLDGVLWELVEEGRDVEAAARRLGVDRALVERVAAMKEASAHKRTLPPTPASQDVAD